MLHSTDGDENLSIEVVILCGGKGSRLQSVVSDRPKSMATLRGRPFLEWQLLSLRDIGFKNVVLCTGYMGWCIQEYFGNGKYEGLHIRYSEEGEARGTGGALRGASPLIQADTVLALNGDSWCDIDISRMIQFHKSHDAEATLGLTTVAHPARYGQVVLDPNGKITEFSEKGQAESKGWINAGMYVLSHDFISRIPEDSSLSLEFDVFPKWIEKGLYGYARQHRFFDIGTPVSYAQAEQEFEQVFPYFPNMDPYIRSTA